MNNAKGTILEETEEVVCINGETLDIWKAMFKYNTDCIPITFFDNVSKISEARKYQITNVVNVSLFKAQKILKIETTDITEADDLSII